MNREPSQSPFGGELPQPRTFEESASLIVPIPFEQTTSYVTGTSRGPHELLVASAQVELWDEELGVDIHPHGMFTLADIDLGALPIGTAICELQKAATELYRTGKFIVALGGEHSITAPIVAGAAAQYPGLTVLQLDAHADLRASYLGEPNSHACAMRRTLEHAPVVQVAIRNISAEEAEALPSLKTTIFYDWNMRDDPRWMDRVIDALSDVVYITIDLDGFDPGLVPAVGTPEPGGLSWREATTLLRRVFERRRVIGCDVVELCPIDGMASSNFIAAKLVYKLLTYKFGLGT